MQVQVQTLEFRKMNIKRNREIKETLELQSDKCSTGEQGGEVEHASVTHAYGDIQVFNFSCYHCRDPLFHVM